MSALVVLAAACGADDLTAPEAPVSAPPGSMSGNVELLVNIAAPSYDQGVAPTFSLASLPATTMAGPNGRITRTISIDPNSPFSGAIVAVDYGRGAGPQQVTVSQSGGGIDFSTGQPLPATYSFQLAQTYPSPGTYIIRVGASTSEGSSIRTHTITVTPDLSVYVDSLVVFGSEPEVRGGTSVAGVPTHFRWWWRGRANVASSVRIEHGDGVSSTIFATPGSDASSHTWAEPGAYTLRVIAIQETFSDTATVQVVVAPPLSCTAGSYLDDRACVPAPAGSYVAVNGATEATPCAAGYYQPLPGKTSCIIAPLGTYVPEPGQTAATPCPVGSFALAQGLIECRLAWRGFYVPTTGAVRPTACAVGTYQPLEGQTSCLAAPPGTMAISTGTVYALPCPQGSYQPLAGQRTCLGAPAGYFVPLQGQTAATPCPLGQYTPEAGQWYYCLSAAVGTYVDEIGSSTPKVCPVGSTTLSTGSTSLSQCLTPSAITLVSVDAAVASGTLVGVGAGPKAAAHLANWVSDLQRSIGFLSGPQRQAGCAGLRNQLAKADGQPSPTDQVSGAARASIAARLQQLIAENCQ